MKYNLKAYTIQEIGQRPNQEDSIFPANGMATVNDRLFILCDGMGGHESGEVASSTVCQAMSRSILSHPDADTNFSINMLQQAIDAAFNALDLKDTSKSGKKMGTTMTFLKLHSAGCTIAHMGDSRVYHIRPGRTAAETQILFRTRDHSLVNDLIRAGEMTEEEARHSNRKNVITRAMQPHMDQRPKADVYNTADIRPGDYFYMCSDGMLEQMDDNGIKTIFAEDYCGGGDDVKIQKLKELTRNNHDNHSAIIVHMLPLVNKVPYGVSVKKEYTTPIKIIVGALVAAFVLALVAIGVRSFSSLLANKGEQKQEEVVPDSSDTFDYEDEDEQNQSDSANSAVNQVISADSLSKYYDELGKLREQEYKEKEDMEKSFDKLNEKLMKVHYSQIEKTNFVQDLARLEADLNDKLQNNRDQCSKKTKEIEAKYEQKRKELNKKYGITDGE